MTVKPSSKWTAYVNRQSDPIRAAKAELEKAAKRVFDLRSGDLALFSLVNEDLSEALAEVSKGNWNMYPENSG